MITVQINQDSLAKLGNALGDMRRRLPRELATAVNATGKKVRIHAARLLKKELNVPVKILKKAVKMKSRATAENTSAKIGLFKGYPIPLKYFKPKQLKRGVTYKINPKLKGKSVLRDAFIVKQYGGNVYKRAGAERYPLIRQNGPSPGDVFEQAGIVAAAVAVAKEELPKQIERRIRFITLQASGGLRGNQTGTKGRGAK
jgi:hypothetical protein